LKLIFFNEHDLSSFLPSLHKSYIDLELVKRRKPLFDLSESKCVFSFVRELQRVVVKVNVPVQNLREAELKEFIS